MSISTVDIFVANGFVNTLVRHTRSVATSAVVNSERVWYLLQKRSEIAKL